MTFDALMTLDPMPALTLLVTLVALSAAGVRALVDPAWRRTLTRTDAFKLGALAVLSLASTGTALAFAP